MRRSRLFLFARFLDILWWVCIFALIYGATLSPRTTVPVWVCLAVTFYRYVNRGLYWLANKREQERAERSHEYGPN